MDEKVDIYMSQTEFDSLNIRELNDLNKELMKNNLIVKLLDDDAYREKEKYFLEEIDEDEVPEFYKEEYGEWYEEDDYEEDDYEEDDYYEEDEEIEDE